MHVATFLLAVVAGLSCSAAQAYQACVGADGSHVRVFWTREVVEIDGQFFQMRFHQSDKTHGRLVGHEMIFAHGKHQYNVLLRNGVRTDYECEPREVDDPSATAKIVPYAPNKIQPNDAWIGPTDAPAEIGGRDAAGPKASDHPSKGGKRR